MGSQFMDASPGTTGLLTRPRPRACGLLRERTAEPTLPGEGAIVRPPFFSSCAVPGLQVKYGIGETLGVFLGGGRRRDGARPRLGVKSSE
jgi:hypothetical protein